MKKAILFIILLTLSSNGLLAQSAYQTEVNQWREKRETGLKAEDSWLSLAGLFWLKAGKNTVGSATGSDVKLPGSTAAQVGAIDFSGGTAHFTVNDGVDVTSNKKAVHEIDLTSDEKGAPTSIELGDVSFTLIKREDLFGIRVKDKNNINRREFKGLSWFPVDESYHIEADFEPYKEPKDVDIPNVLGGVYRMKSPGLLKFTIKGQEYTLQPVEEDDQLFIIFSDQTAKKTTYQSGRFLYTKRPVDGKVVLDFNEAYNPPCAFTEFATCPLPPPENKLKTAITAGEKRYDH